jgi:deoxyribodipyrimidine photo-lyase
MTFSLVYFKRDLRIADNEAVSSAPDIASTRYIYIFEPGLWRLPTSSYKHYLFISACLIDLSAALAAIGKRLEIVVGEADEVLRRFIDEGARDIYSMEETGNAWTFERDKGLKRLFRSRGVRWHEYQTGGVIRPLPSRDMWAALRDDYMRAPLLTPPKGSEPCDHAISLPQPDELGIDVEEEIGIQYGGRMAGLSLLRSFLDERCKRYSKDLSSPLTGEWGCSRLSPYIAYGALSLREIVHAVEKTRAGSPYKRSLASFTSRLYWHCHFIQKLEQRPSIEKETMHPLFEQLDRERSPDSPLFIAWCDGKTGYPFVDACMRFLLYKGWLNFRMRAMLASFAAYDLWLDWRLIAPHLARHFTDYEPGIHYPQLQMQSGTTGINTLRIYDPVKQSVEHDPEGRFIATWVPELARLPRYYIHTPWLMDKSERETYGIAHDGPYVEPIVDHKAAVKRAKSAFSAIMALPDFQMYKRRVMQQLGSRKTAHMRAG